MRSSGAKWSLRYVASAIAVVVIGIVLYLGAVLGVYFLAAVLGLIGLIFN